MLPGGLEGRDTEVQGKTTHQVMKELAASRPSLGYAPTRDLPKLTAGDQMGVHYNGQSQISIGARFAYEAARLAGKDAGSVRSGRYEAPLGSPDAWMNRKMPGKNVGVWNLASSVKPSIVSGVVKLFGIRVEDPAVNTVIIQSKGGGSGDRLALGPGGIRLAEGKICSWRQMYSLRVVRPGIFREAPPWNSSPRRSRTKPTPSACPDRRKCRWFVRKAEGERREWPASCWNGCCPLP